MTNSNQKIETPIEFVRALEEYFMLTFKYDLAGYESNKKAPIVFTEEQNSLKLDWPTDGWCFLNPPFRNLTRWINKCKEQRENGARIVSVWPLSCDLNQIITYAHSDVYMVHGRLWPEVRGIMICVWDIYERAWGNQIQRLLWDKKDKKIKSVLI